MSDMKIRIVIEDGSGNTRTATLSFGEGGGSAETESEEATLIDRLREMHFTVREEIPLLEPGMIGELHMERLYGSRDICCDCGKPMWIMMEVVEDGSDSAHCGYPFLDVDHDLIGDVCIHCGHLHTNEEMSGAGVFGLLDEEAYPKLQDFLDAIGADEPDALVRSHLMQALIRQERLHTKAVFRIRQRLTQIRIEAHEAKVLELPEKGE